MSSLTINIEEQKLRAVLIFNRFSTDFFILILTKIHNPLLHPECFIVLNGLSHATIELKGSKNYLNFSL